MSKLKRGSSKDKNKLPAVYVPLSNYNPKQPHLIPTPTLEEWKAMFPGFLAPNYVRVAIPIRQKWSLSGIFTNEVEVQENYIKDRRTGFLVIDANIVPHSGMEQAEQEFLSKIKSGTLVQVHTQDISLFMQSDVLNYAVPVPNAEDYPKLTQTIYASNGSYEFSSYVLPINSVLHVLDDASSFIDVDLLDQEESN